MQHLKTDFIEFLCQKNVLQFGEFTLKSGRLSPYFFNLGLFNDGESLMRLGEFYATALQESNFEYDLLFGPAYKGIPLVSAIAIGLYHQYQKNVPYAFNRKERKKHGDQGTFVGAPLEGRMVVVDDVISAGTTIREISILIESLPVKISGILIALDRQERSAGEKSAIEDIKEQYHIDVHSIITLTDIIAYVDQHPILKIHLPAIQDYQSEYGI